MAGKLNQQLDQIVQQFNQSQNTYRVVAIYKGQYTTSLTTAAAAYRAHTAPAILQAAEMSTAIMVNADGAVIPLYQLQKQTGVHLDTSDFLPAIRSYYAGKNGQLAGFPFNTSSAVMFYNAAAFKKAGISAPKTWQKMPVVAQKLKATGMNCAFTTTWPSWIQVEQFSAWQNIPFATQNNGFDNLHAKLLINNPVMKQHLQQLQDWQDSGVFRYGGRQDAAQNLFLSQQCAMMFSSSGSLANLKANATFPLGTAMLPYDAKVKGAPFNTILGGAALWTLSGQKPDVYKGVAEFYKFLMHAKVQEKWAEETGYLPTTNAAYQHLIKQGYYRKHPGAKVALLELNNKKPTANTQGIRLGNYPLIRIAINSVLEGILSGKISVTDGLNKMSSDSNALIATFAQENS